MNDEAEKIENEYPDVELVPDEEGGLPDLQAKIKKLKEESARSEKERKEYLDGWQRAKADFINYKKDEGKRFEDLVRYASAGFMEEVLPVLDSFDLALAAGAGSGATHGMILIRSQLADILKKRGVEEIVVVAGDAFNPEKHESIGEMQSEYPAGAIAEVSQRGYAFSGRVIRPARVKLSKNTSAEYSKSIQ